MTTKRQLIELLSRSRMGDQSSLREVLDAIIDALPEEPKINPEWEKAAYCKEESGAFVKRTEGGPDPVEVKESQPTSALREAFIAGVLAGGFTEKIAIDWWHGSKWGGDQ